MAEIYGCMFGVFTIGNAVGRYLLAAGFDVLRSYVTPLAFAFLAMILAVMPRLLIGIAVALTRWMCFRRPYPDQIWPSTRFFCVGKIHIEFNCSVAEPAR